MEYEVTTREALGRIASVGDLYDVRSDNFCSGLSIFKKIIPNDALIVKEAHSCEIHVTHSDSYEEKFEKLNIRGALSASVLSGIVKLDGAGRYLNEQKKTSRSVQNSLLYKISTKDEQLNINNKELKESIAFQAIKSPMATHVVTGISWGANSVVTCSYENRDNRDVSEVEGYLKATVASIKVSFSGMVSSNWSEGNNAGGIKFDVRIFMDILPTKGELPTTFEGAVELMKQLPSLVEKCNGGKGKPLAYRLMPIQLVGKYLEVDGVIDVTLRSLENSSILRVVQFFDKMSVAQQELNSFHQDVTEHKYCVRKEDMSEISDLGNAVAIEESNLRSELSTLLIGIRSGKKSTTELENLMKKFTSSPAAPDNIRKRLDAWESIREKISVATTLVKEGATFIGSNASPKIEMMKHNNSKLFMLHFNAKSLSDLAEGYPKLQKNMKILSEEIAKKSEGCRFYVVDCDFFPNLIPKGKSSFVKVTEAGTCISEDLLDAKGSTISVPEVDKNTPPSEDWGWVTASPEMLSLALKGGHEPKYQLYVARSEHDGGIIPGKVVCDGNRILYKCIAWNGQEFKKPEAELLIASYDQVSWIKMSGGPIPQNAIPGGECNGETLYIGRAHHLDTLTIGMVRGAKCVIGLQRSEAIPESVSSEMRIGIDGPDLAEAYNEQRSEEQRNKKL